MPDACARGFFLTERIMEWAQHRQRSAKTCSIKFKPNVDECVKVKVRVKFTLEQATKAHRGSRGIALLFL